MSGWDVRVLFDGECPLCSREVRLLKRLDRGRGRVAFDDIAAADFDAARYGRSARNVSERIHGVLPDGRVIEGMEVFRRSFGAVGLGWLLAPTRWWGLSRVADAAYRVFARNRLRLTGRSDACASGTCGTPPATKARKLTTTVLLVLALLAPGAEAAEIEGVHFVEERRAGDEALRLHGTGLLRYRIVIKAYVAALYVGESVDVDGGELLGDVPRRLEIEYFWALRADQFADATTQGILRSTDPAAFERLRGAIEQMNALYEDVEPGDRYAITYLPGVGTELARNGRSLGVVEGAEFSAALFGIWLGDAPLDASLRRQLLTGI